MNTLTATIAVPQITNLRVTRVAPDLDDAVVYITVQARNATGLVFPMPLPLVARNGISDGVRAKVTPVGFFDRLEIFQVATPTGFTDVLAAFEGASLAIRNRAIETALIAAGLMPAGVVS